MIVPAFSIWLIKNSPKFLIYILHFMASTTATALFSSTSASDTTSCTAFITSESFPTPEGSIKILSGAYVSNTSFKEVPKSPTSEQQMQPEFISLISIPASFKNPPSMPISPNSFSINTTFASAKASFKSFFINVVFPAPKKPDTISIFVISIMRSFLCHLYLYHFKHAATGGTNLTLNVFCACFSIMSSLYT